MGTAWDFANDTVTASVHLYPVFKLKPATYEVAAHIFGEWSVETQARTAETVKVRSCQVCGYEERVSVPAEPDVKKISQ